MKYEFCHGSDLCEISRREGVPISEIMMRNEMEKSERTRESITAEMKSNLDVMRASIREGLEADEQHRGIFVGGDAAKLMAFAGQSNLGTDMAEVIASAIALKNIMGLVCDPVGGLVECPCVKRNAIGAANAVLSCDLALAGIRSLIPFDEVVDTMKRVGDRMHADLKETARGGLTAAPTAQRLAERLSGTEA